MVLYENKCIVTSMLLFHIIVSKKALSSCKMPNVFIIIILEPAIHIEKETVVMQCWESGNKYIWFHQLS